MKFNVNKFGLAAGLTGTVIQFFLSIFMWFMHSGKMMGMMQSHHMNNQSMMTQMFSPTAFFVRTIWIFAIFYIGAALFAWIYNKLVKK